MTDRLDQLDEATLRRLVAAGRALTANTDGDRIRDELLSVAQELTGARHAAIAASPPGPGVLAVPIMVSGEAWGELHLCEGDGAFTAARRAGGADPGGLGGHRALERSALRPPPGAPGRARAGGAGPGGHDGDRARDRHGDRCRACAGADRQARPGADRRAGAGAAAGRGGRAGDRGERGPGPAAVAGVTDPDRGDGGGRGPLVGPSAADDRCPDDAQARRRGSRRGGRRDGDARPARVSRDAAGPAGRVRQPHRRRRFDGEQESLLARSPPAPPPRWRRPRPSSTSACATRSRRPRASAAGGPANCTTRRCRGWPPCRSCWPRPARRPTGRPSTARSRSSSSASRSRSTACGP